MDKQSFNEGYEQCMRDLEQMLDASIRRHNGAKTTLDCFNVMNDVIHWTHSQGVRIISEQKELQEVM